MSVSLVLESPVKQTPSRSTAKALSPLVLSKIYQDEVNLAVWQNKLTTSLIQSVETLINEAPNFKVVLIASPNATIENLRQHHSQLADKHELCEYIGLLVDMFSTLFEQERVGIRLNLVGHAMCPKFHVDNVPCRLVTTFLGPATEWLNNDSIDRSKLGAGSLGLTDEASGIYQDETDINCLKSGDVAILKGEGWFNNELGGLVHRSPALTNNQKRLVLTLDFSN